MIVVLVLVLMATLSRSCCFFLMTPYLSQIQNIRKLHCYNHLSSLLSLSLTSLALVLSSMTRRKVLFAVRYVQSGKLCVRWSIDSHDHNITHDQHTSAIIWIFNLDTYFSSFSWSEMARVLRDIIEAHPKIWKKNIYLRRCRIFCLLRAGYLVF